MIRTKSQVSDFTAKKQMDIEKVDALLDQLKNNVTAPPPEGGGF